MPYDQTLDSLCVNTIRALILDAVLAAGGARPNAALEMAPAVYRLWQYFFRYDPEDPRWPNRDRFVLSASHASPLLYAVLHMAGVREVNPEYETLGRPAVGLDDIKNFKQPGGKCPGYPECRITSGVEASTGPLGQGVATSVGIAAAGQWQASYFNRPGHNIFGYDVYALCGDGCMMEGVAAEAASLAGHLKLSNLCWIYDKNHTTAEGNTAFSFTENTSDRFSGYGWNIVKVNDVENFNAIDAAFRNFKKTSDCPTLIIVENQSSKTELLRENDVLEEKSRMGFSSDECFSVSNEARRHFRAGIGKRGRALRNEWFSKKEKYCAAHPQLADNLERMLNEDLPGGWDDDLPAFNCGEEVSARQASSKALGAIARNAPWLIGGTADLSPSASMRIDLDGEDNFSAANYKGRNIHFGVREHAMGSFLNGLALSGLRPFGSSHLVFSDYESPAVRMSAIMEIPVIHIFSYDSIDGEEDSPASQPIEQLASLRSIPGLIVFRPADANEAVEAWRFIMELRRQPTALVLSARAIPVMDRTKGAPASELRKGAYVLRDPDKGDPDVLLMAAGPETALCLEAHEQLKRKGIKSRVISMPSLELFERQNKVYRDHILPPEIKARVAVEQASTMGWDRYAGTGGAILGMNVFGSSKPFNEFRGKQKLTSEAVAAAARMQLDRSDADREDREWI